MDDKTQLALFVGWVRANGLDPGQIPYNPYLFEDVARRELTVEMLWLDSDGHPLQDRCRVVTKRVTVPLVVTSADYVNAQSD